MNSVAQKLNPNNLEIKNVDREGLELRIGDRVGFIMRGWFQPREQECFGLISDIDSRGGITIEVVEGYRCFTSSGRVGAKFKSVYFSHHVYDPSEKTRVFAKENGEHLLSIFRIDSDEQERKVREASNTDTNVFEPVAAARAAARKGL